MMTAVMSLSVTVLERQYKKYFEINLTAKLAEETKSARSHNIDAEEIMGMFSAPKKKSPNATICFLSAKMRAIKYRIGSPRTMSPLMVQNTNWTPLLMLGNRRRSRSGGGIETRYSPSIGITTPYPLLSHRWKRCCRVWSRHSIKLGTRKSAMWRYLNRGRLLAPSGRLMLALKPCSHIPMPDNHVG